jgi:hypothetical protein
MLQLKTNRKMQKTHRCGYVSDFLRIETKKNFLKSGVRPLETYENRVKTHKSENQPEIRKPQLLPEEQIKEVTKVVLDRWQPYIAKYP